MICPKCRKRYEDGIKCCPDCGFELVGVIGDMDIPGDSIYDSVSDVPEQKTNDGFSPVLYKVKDEKNVTTQGKNVIAIIILIIGIIFLLACIAFFIKGKFFNSLSFMYVYTGCYNLLI